MATKPMDVVFDAEGRFVGAAFKNELKKKGASAGIAALSGQILRTVEVPEEVGKISSAIEMHLLLSRHLFIDGNGQVAMRKLNVRRTKGT